MELPKYDPGVAANIISVVAMIVAAMSYRLTKKAEASRKESQLPDVTSVASPMKDNPGWHHVYLTIRNNFPTDLYATGVSLKRPGRAVGVNSAQAFQHDDPAEPKLLVPLPADLAKRTIDIRTGMGPSGTARHQYGLHAGDKAWISIYVLVPPGALELTFNVEFSVRETDIRRKDRHVSHQKVTLTARQTN